jgi:1,4-dihydroxy-2-naphthoate octaprenyltransferase
MLPPACVALGVGTALWTTGHVNVWHVALALAGALAAHISVNALNEYFDFESGLDFKTQRTPFSGGSGTLPGNPDKAPWAMVTGWSAFGLTALVGLYFVWVRGWALLPLGLLGLLVIAIYTLWLTRVPLLCLVAPGLGFGVFMVMGADFVLTGRYSWPAFAASLVPFFLVSDLLLLNQFPDVDADRSVGRRHLPITIGRGRSAVIYSSFLGLTYLSVAVAVYLGCLPRASLLGLLMLVVAVPTAVGVLKHADDMSKLKPYLGLNVMLNLLTPVLVAVGLLIA